MRLLGNILWFILGGWLLFVVYTIAAIIFFPVFLPIFRIARYSLFPFGKEIVYKTQLNKYRELTKAKIDVETDSEESKKIAQGASKILNIFWVLTFGWILALTHLVAAIVNIFLIFLIVTIPNIGGHWKMMKIAFMPFNTVIVPERIAEEIKEVIIRNGLNV